MLTADSARDPDYRTGWPPGARVRDVRVGDGTVTVDIGRASRNNVGSEAAHQAVQQLIWTATAASGQPGLRLLIDGQAVDELWGHVAVSGTLRRAAQQDVQARVWLMELLGPCPPDHSHDWEESNSPFLMAGSARH